MEFEIQQTKLHDILTRWSEQINVPLVKDCNEYRLQLPEHIGNGFIHTFCFDHGLSLWLIRCQFKEDVVIHLTGNEYHPLQFMFCSQGTFKYTLQQQNLHCLLHPLMGIISANTQNERQSFIFPAHQDIVFTNLEINRLLYTEKVNCNLDKMHDSLQAIFSDTNAQEVFFHQSNYSIPIANCIKKIRENKYKDLVRSTYIEGKALELLSLQIQQFKDDQSPLSEQNILRKYELEKIILARDLLIKDLRKSTTIANLAKQIGLNQQKLKKGFKAIFKTTIRSYLTKERLKLAALLLANGEQTVGEVAENVGYTNRSHFTRLFNKQYGVLPKDYANRLRKKIIV